jgi:hypothetical protein
MFHVELLLVFHMEHFGGDQAGSAHLEPIRITRCSDAGILTGESQFQPAVAEIFAESSSPTHNTILPERLNRLEDHERKAECIPRALEIEKSKDSLDSARASMRPR